MVKLLIGLAIFTVASLAVMGAFNIGLTRGQEKGTQAAQAAQAALDEAMTEIDRLSAALEAEQSQPAPAPGGADGIHEYYRGVYDVCVWAVMQQGGTGDAVAQYCNQFVAGADQAGWYEQPSEGYKWPPTSTQGGVASHVVDNAPVGD